MGTNNPAAADRLKRAEEAVANNDFDRAIAEYTEAIHLDPNVADFYLDRGLCYGDIGEDDKAIADHTKAIGLDPKNGHAYSNRALSYIATGEFDKAIADCTKAIGLDPKNAHSYAVRAMSYRGIGEFDKAIADFTVAIGLDPKMASSYGNRGACYVGKGEHDKAYADYTKAIRLDPKVADYYFWRFWCCREKGDLDKAVASLTEAIRLDRNVAYEFIADCTEAIGLDPNLRDHYWRGVCYSQTGANGEACADFTEAIRLGCDPEAAARAHNFRGVCCFRMGETDKASADFTEAIRLEPKVMRFPCRGCGKRLKVPTGKCGRKATCPSCSRKLVIPRCSHAAIVYYNRGRCHARGAALEEPRGVAQESSQIVRDFRAEMDYENQEQIANAIAESHGMEFIDLTELTVPAAVIELVPEPIARENCVLPLMFDKGVLHIAMSDPGDLDMVQKLQFILIPEKGAADAQYLQESWGFAITAIRPRIAPRAQIIKAINRHYGQTESGSAESLLAEFADYAIGGFTGKGIGDCPAAIADFTAAIGLDASAADSYSWRARCYVGAGDLAKAIADYTAVIVLDSHEAEHYWKRGRCYHQTGEHDRAIADFIEASFLCAIMLLNREEAATVIAHLTEAIRLDPENAFDYDLRGRILAGTGEHAKAIADYTRAIQLDPGHPPFYANRGNCYDHLDEDDKASADFTEAIRLDPNNATNYSDRGVIYSRRYRDLAKAVADYTEVIRLLAGPNPRFAGRGRKVRGERPWGFDIEMAEAYYSRSLAYHQMGDHEKANADKMQSTRLRTAVFGLFNPFRISTGEH